jgi:hypothetical protein
MMTPFEGKTVSEDFLKDMVRTCKLEVTIEVACGKQDCFKGNWFQNHNTEEVGEVFSDLDIICM